MNDNTHVTRRPRRAWQPTTRTAAAIIAAASLALVAAAAYGRSPSSTGPGGSSNQTGSQAKAEAARIAKERAAHHGSNGGTGPGSTPTGIALLALDEASRYLLPLLLVLGGLCLIAGPLLYFLPAYRRRHQPTGGSE